MASDMLGTMDRRFQAMSDQLHREGQSQAEAMVKVAEILGQKIDRLGAQVDQGMGDDIQIVVDRMSDAIQAMSAREPPRYRLARRATTAGPCGSPARSGRRAPP